MGPDLDLKGKSMGAMDVSPSKEGIKEPEGMTCANNCEDDSLLIEAVPNEHTPDRSEDAEINITDSINSKGKGHFKVESEDATEDSSSFGNTDSGVKNDAMSNDVEVESELRYDGSSSLALDGFDDLFQTRKKKLTAHWRKFIRPLMWRCKWTELQIRELQAQSLKYGRELAECDQRRQDDLLNFTSEDLAVKSTPISFKNRKVNIMKRKKRKQVEETTDVALYMSQHNLFSFLVNKKSHADRPYMDDDFGNSMRPAKSNFTTDEFGVNGVWPCLEFKDDATLEEILHKIDGAKIQLHMVKVRMDKVISENADKIYSNIAVSSPCDAPTSSVPQTLPHIDGKCRAGSLVIASQQTSHIREDVVMHESAVSSYGEVIPTDTIDSTDQPEIGPPYQKIEDEVLIYNNQSIKLEDGVEPVGKPQVTSALLERNAAHPTPDAETVSQSKKAAPPAQQSVKMRSISKLGTPKNKRKRARRKARPKYSRRSSG